MIKLVKPRVLLYALALLSLGFFGMWNAAGFRYYDVTVLDKMQPSGGYRTPKFILIVEEPTSGIFDLNVDAACYSQVKKGQVLTFKLERSRLPNHSRWWEIQMFCSYLIFLGSFIIAIFAFGVRT